MAVDNARVRVLKVALIAAGGDNGLIGDLDGGVERPFLPGIPDADIPVTAVRLAAQTLDVAPQAQQGGGHTGFSQNLAGPLGGIALADAAQINLPAVFKGHSDSGNPDMVGANTGKSLAQFGGCGHMIILIVEAPELYQRIDAGVKKSIRGIVQLQSPFQQGERLRGQGGAAAFVEPGDFAVRETGA